MAKNPQNLCSYWPILLQAKQPVIITSHSEKFKNFSFNLNLKKGFSGSLFFGKYNKNLIKMNDNGIIAGSFSNQMFCENNLFGKSTALSEDQPALSPGTFNKMFSFDYILHFNELSVNLILYIL